MNLSGICRTDSRLKESDANMKKLIEQALKFGVVGIVCFFIDYVIGIVVLNILMYMFGAEYFQKASIISSALGFTISVIANYILSFKFVFERKEDMNRKAEFVVFLILSIIGLGLNTLIIWICTGPIYSNIQWLQKVLNETLAYTGAKIIATGIVMVYNFVTRKIFLEKKEQ